METYNNENYTHNSDSDGEGLFALTDFNDDKDWNGDPHHCICMCKVKVLVDKFTME